MHMQRLIQSSIIAAAVSLTCIPRLAFAQSDGSETASAEPSAQESSSDAAPSTGDAGSDRQPDWVECWRRFLESHEGGRDWRAEWQYDGSCSY
jgi:hypothetical protein